MNPLPFILLAISLPLLLGGCGGEKKEPVSEVKAVEEKQQAVKTEEPVAETKPTEEVPVNPNLKYEIKDGMVTITGCDRKASGTITIPATIDGNPVSSIGNEAFYQCSSLTSIVISDSVTSIGSSAFVSCESLTSITIPDSVTSIGGGAFYGCASLTSITIPDSVTSIGEGSFFFCDSLTNIEVGAGNGHYASINGVLFNAEKTMLLTYPEGKTDANYTIPNSVTSIEDRAFSSITYPTFLTTITIGNGVTSIGERAFMNCSSLTNIEVGTGNVNYASVNGVLFNAEKTVLLAYPARKTGANYTIPDSVTLIEADAFDGCRSLTNIKIPDGVTSIGDSTFASCNSLTSITIPDRVTSIGDSAFFFCDSLTSITIPDGVTSIGNSAFMGCKSLTSITIPDSVTSIGDHVFRKCESLTPVTFLGDAPKATENMFFATSVTIYRKPEAKGWGETFGGRSVKLISEKP